MFLMAILNFHYSTTLIIIYDDIKRYDSLETIMKLDTITYRTDIVDKNNCNKNILNWFS